MFFIFSGQKPGNFHIIITNDCVEKAYTELREFLSKNVDEKDDGKFQIVYLVTT